MLASILSAPGVGYPQVTIGPHEATCLPAGLSFTCTYPLDTSENDGLQQVTIFVSDMAGNVIVDADPARKMTFDFTPPTLSASSVRQQRTAQLA